jgi:hypothetical protein
MPVPAALASGAVTPAAAPKPTIRLQAPDPPPARPARLTLASPEALGVRASGGNLTAAPALDWNRIHARLASLGALGFHLDRLVSGGSRVTFMLPMPAQRIHQIEVTADTEAAAVTSALEHAEAWVAAQK